MNTRAFVLFSIFFTLFLQNAFCGELFDEYVKSRQQGASGSYHLFNEYANQENAERKFEKYDEIFKERKLVKSTEAFLKHIKKNDIETVKLYLEAGINPNTAFYNTYPLFYAAKYDRYEIAKILIENGADPNLGFDSPLYQAVCHKNIEMVELLLSQNTRMEYKDVLTGKTPLQKALETKQYEIAQMLIEHGARIDYKSKLLLEKRK